ncbi:MAG TPA: hypothetical protein VNN18_08125 [Candidatus Xenobia bacterium]|nr:hypothetical protein [Candidatus Xenobia bacterium]
MLLAASLAPADDPGKLRQQLQQTTDPVERAKLTAKLGDAMLKQMAVEYKAKEYEAGDRLLGEYLESVRAAYRGLRDSGRNARKKPAGFKDLEIHLRKSARVLEDLSKLVPFEERQPLQQAVEEVAEIRTGLLEALMSGSKDTAPRSGI